MYIPKEFNLYNQLIKVKYSRTLINGKQKALGLADYNKNKITLQQSLRSYPISKESQEITFVHESVHLMLDKLGYRELAQDETLVDGLANILYQFITQIEDKK